MLDACKKVVKISFPMADILFANRGTQGLGHIHRAGGEKQMFVQIQVTLQRRSNLMSQRRYAHGASPSANRAETSRGHKSSSKTQSY